MSVRSRYIGRVPAKVESSVQIAEPRSETGLTVSRTSGIGQEAAISWGCPQRLVVLRQLAFETGQQGGTSLGSPDDLFKIDANKLGCHRPRRAGAGKPEKPPLQAIRDPVSEWLACSGARLHPAEMFIVTEEAAAAVRAAYEQGGELAAAVELRRLFPGLANNEDTRICSFCQRAWTTMSVQRIPSASSMPSSIGWI
jgi:hypothetical protein